MGAPPARPPHHPLTKEVITICGIAGWSLKPDHNVDVAILAASLAISIEHRGRDATGVAFSLVGERGVGFAKAPQPASDFVATALESVPPKSLGGIVHTRAGTKGSEQDNNNNHPIIVPRQDGDGHVIGVHNGIIVNDDQVFRNYASAERIAQVDSEAIFQLLAIHGDPAKLHQDLDGDAAIAWLETTDHLRVNIAMLGGRPCHIAPVWDVNEFQGWVFASEADSIKYAFAEAQLYLPQGAVIRRLDDGQRWSLRLGDLERHPDIGTIERPYWYSNDFWDRATGPSQAASPKPVVQMVDSWRDLDDIEYEEQPSDDTPLSLSDYGDVVVDLARALAAILLSPSFYDTDPREWDLEDTSEIGDTLWYNDRLSCWASVSPAAFTVVALTDPTNDPAVRWFAHS